MKDQEDLTKMQKPRIHNLKVTEDAVPNYQMKMPKEDKLGIEN